jgi:membrane protease YdiL (CAAX protease family)
MIVRRFPLVAYFVLAYALTWWVYPLLRISPLIGIFGLFGPALAAIIVTGVTDGRRGVRILLSRVVRWRVPVPWYLVALGLPAALALLAAGLSVLLGPSTAITVGRLSVLDIVLVILVVGEELGWRGYALPKLIERRSPLVASLIIGVLWGAWHLPTFFIPGTPQFDQPIVAFLVMTTAYSILLTWLFLHTGGSVLLATLFHGAINIFQGFFLAGVDPASRYWWLALSYGTAALALAAMLRRWDSRHRTAVSSAQSRHRAIAEREELR